MTVPAFTPRNILITGATGGFGSAMARQFAALGCDLTLHARNAEKLDVLAASLPGAKITKLVFDIRDTKAMEKTVSGIGAVDVLVNNAGLALGLEPAQRADLADWDEMIDTNIRSLAHLTRLILPGMVERKSGHVINLGSVAGSWPYPNGNVYAATKAFVAQFSHTLRCDLHGTGVRVTNIEPGMAETNFSVLRFKGDAERAAKVYENTTPLSSDDVADAVIWAATRPIHVNINTIEVMPTAQSLAGVQVAREA
jgi:3-hydroxy acid dehydrogenase/malonic semialdehyde reductase